MCKNMILGLLLSSSLCVADILMKSNDGASIVIPDGLVNQSKTLTDLVENELIPQDNAGNAVYVSDMFIETQIKYLYELLKFAQHHALPIKPAKLPKIPSLQDHLEYQKAMDQISESFKQQFPDELLYKELFAIAEFFDVPVIMQIIAQLLLTPDLDVPMLEGGGLVGYTPSLQMAMAQQLKKRIAVYNAQRLETMAQWRNRFEGIPNLVNNLMSRSALLLPMGGMYILTKNLSLSHSLGSNFLLPAVMGSQFRERIQRSPDEQTSVGWYYAPIVANVLLGAMLNQTDWPFAQKAMGSLLLQAPAVAIAWLFGSLENIIRQGGDEFKNIKNELKSYIDNKIENPDIANALPQLMNNYEQIKMIPNRYLPNSEKLSVRAFIEIAIIEALLRKELIEIVPWIRNGNVGGYALISKPNASPQVQNILSLFTKSDGNPFYRSLYEFDPSVIKYVKQKESDANIAPPASLNTLGY